jgi:hypothetical protein
MPDERGIPNGSTIYRERSNGKPNAAHRRSLKGEVEKPGKRLKTALTGPTFTCKFCLTGEIPN